MAKKLILDISEDIWKEVLKYKIDNDLKNNNEAVVKLIKKGLEKNKFDFGK
jgi:hypothetical protein